MRHYLVHEFESLRHPARRGMLRAIRAEAAAAPHGERMTDLAFFTISFVCGFIIFMGMIA